MKYFGTAATIAVLSGLGGQSEIKMREVDPGLCSLDKRTLNCAATLLGP